VPPEVITGRLRVLVGGDVVVVVVGGDVVGDAEPELTPGSDAPGVEVLGVEVVGVSAGAGEDPLAPGRSFATTTPMAMVAPAASNAAARVRRRTRASARPRVSGELGCGVELTGHVLGSASFHGSSGA
jgi:hypothetical protein